MTQKAKKNFFCKSVAIFLACHLASCGTLLYPERRGQPPGYLDAGVVALDAVGLLLFLVPGVIAFAVDFATGTIYLPPERPYFYSASRPANFETIRVDPAELTPRRLETIVREQTGETINLEPGTYRAARLGEIVDFTPTALKGLQSNPVMNNVIFRASSE